MSPQDTQMLNDFLNQLIQARGIQKDQEADAMIQRAVAQQPDAAYLLVQRSLLLEQALNNAKGQIAQLENQLSQQQRSGQQGGGFLDANSWGNSGGSRPAGAPMQQAQREVQQAPQQYQPQYQPQYQAPMGGGLLGARSGGFLGGGMLGSIAATAAGVAAGSFLFHGLDNMFHHHDQGGGNHLLSDNGNTDPANNLFSDQSGSSLADQAGLGDVGQSFDNASSTESLFDTSADNGGLDGGEGFFDGDGSDEGLFS